MNYEYKHLNKYEKRIILFLNSYGEASTRKIARLLSIHWTTTKNNMKSLEDKRVVKKIVMGNKILWKLNLIKV